MAVLLNTIAVEIHFKFFTKHCGAGQPLTDGNTTQHTHAIGVCIQSGTIKSYVMQLITQK